MDRPDKYFKSGDGRREKICLKIDRGKLLSSVANQHNNPPEFVNLLIVIISLYDFIARMLSDPVNV